jgi:hypothetical protein
VEDKLKIILNRWLEVEYYFIANKTQFIKRIVRVNENLIMETIRILDYLTTMDEKPDKNYVITIVALMWDHIDRVEYDIKSFIVKILSRIGYPTSAIIIDENYDKEKCQFFRMNSIMDQVTTTLYQRHNEVCVSKKSFLLTDFQKDIWNNMDNTKVLGISAPTSAGKSFVLLLKSIENMIIKNIDIIYIVPTLSLLNQVTEDYNNMLKKLEIKNYRIMNTFTPDDCENHNRVFVLTQEKALAAFSNEKKVFSTKILLIVDEIQNIERITEDTDTRAKILYDTLIEFRHNENVEKIVISGPRINEIDTLGNNIFGEDTEELRTNISPVLNLTYSIKKSGNKYYFRQSCALNQESIEKEINNFSIIEGYGKKSYDESYLVYLINFINRIGKKEQNIIFSPTSDQARKIACAIANNNDNNQSIDILDDLIEYYKDTISKNYAMCYTLKQGVAYHHGKLPMHVRRTLERAISDKLVSNVVCTTTLMQGVNMPAQNIIIRNPHLYVKKKADSTELSSYEMANLRGRAGRLLKDFIGRTYVLDESGFEDLEDYDQLELFDEVSKEITSGYGEKFEVFKDDIFEVIESTKTVDGYMQRYGYLVTYIRQSVLRYGKNSKTRMAEVGIELSAKQVAAIMSKLSSIQIPREICYKNRYWDPFVLNEIFIGFQGKVPNIPVERGAKYKFDKLLKYLRDNDATKPMYEKYIPQKYQRAIGRSMLCTACIEWACEKSLRDLLLGEYYEGENATEHIDDMIKLLQETVSFNVPLLLKPIFDIFNSESAFLTCMQTGAYKPYTRKMIEIGIPRETAIYLNIKLFEKCSIENKTDTEADDEIRKIIKDNYVGLPYWIKVQLNFMI